MTLGSDPYPYDLSPIRLSIAESVREAFPEVGVAGFRVTGLSRAAAVLPVDDVLRSARDRLASQVDSTQALVSDPRIAGWRGAVGACGLKPSTFKSGAEQLARRLLKGQAISTPLPVVDAYCAVSVAHLAPLGAYDVARLPRAEISLRHAAPGDAFRPLAGRAESMPLTPEVVVYASGSDVLCWCFNHRDSALTCLREETEDAIFMGEAVNAEQAQALGEAMQELRGVLVRAGAVVGPIVHVQAGAAAATESDVHAVA